MQLRQQARGVQGRAGPRTGLTVRAIAAPPRQASSQPEPPAAPPSAPLKPVPRLPGMFPYLGILHKTSLPKAFQHVAETERAHRMRLAEVEILGKTVVRARHPEDIVRVVMKEHDKYVKGPLHGSFADWLAKGLATNQDPVHHSKVREVMMPGFKPEAIRSYTAMFTGVANALADVLLESEGQPLNMEPLMQRATLDVIGLAGFSYDFRAVAMASKGYKPSASGAAEIDAGAVWTKMMPAGMLVGAGLPIPEAWIPGIEHFIGGVAKLDEIAAHMMSEHRAGRVTGNRRSILSYMMEAQAAGNEVMTDKQIRDELMTLMLAGSDTTATTLSFSCWELSRRPEVLARVVAEVEGVMAGRTGPIGAEDVARMPLLTACINESLRCYSAAPTTMRIATEDSELGGYAIPKGTSVILDIWALHRHEDYWPRPDEWLPERWLPENAPTLAPHAATAFMPFSVGPRACIGRYFAVLEAQVVLAQLLRRVSFSEAPGQPPMGLLQQLTLSSEHGIMLVPAVRA